MALLLLPPPLLLLLLSPFCHVAVGRQCHSCIPSTASCNPKRPCMQCMARAALCQSIIHGVPTRPPCACIGPLPTAACSGLLWLPAECGDQRAVCQWARRQAHTGGQAETAGECPASAASQYGQPAQHVQPAAHRGPQYARVHVHSGGKRVLWPAPSAPVCLRPPTCPTTCLPACLPNHLPACPPAGRRGDDARAAPECPPGPQDPGILCRALGARSRHGWVRWAGGRVGSTCYWGSLVWGSGGQQLQLAGVVPRGNRPPGAGRRILCPLATPRLPAPWPAVAFASASAAGSVAASDPRYQLYLELPASLRTRIIQQRQEGALAELRFYPEGMTPKQRRQAAHMLAAASSPVRLAAGQQLSEAVSELKAVDTDILDWSGPSYYMLDEGEWAVRLGGWVAGWAGGWVGGKVMGWTCNASAERQRSSMCPQLDV